MFLLIVLNVFPFTPRYMIPVAGMMVGNAMTVTGVTMKQLRDDIKMQLNLVKSFTLIFNFTQLNKPNQIPGLIDLVKTVGRDGIGTRSNTKTSNAATGEESFGDISISGFG